MTLPILLFEAGTHGNLLSRCLSISSGTVKKFDVWGSKLGAHDNGRFQRVIDHFHASQTDAKDIHTFITYSYNDLYKIMLYNLYAGGEHNLYLLNDTNLKERLFKNQHPVILSSKSLNSFENSLTGNRELLKYIIKNFHNSYISTIQQQFDIRNICYTINYKDFFEKDNFIAMTKNTLTRLGYQYKTDVSDIHEKFLERMQPFIQSENRVTQAFTAWKNNESFDLGDFLLVEQACLDYYIEQHRGYEIENWQEYPTNTQDLNPIEAWEGVRYDL